MHIHQSFGANFVLELQHLETQRNGSFLQEHPEFLATYL